MKRIAMFSLFAVGLLSAGVCLASPPEGESANVERRTYWIVPVGHAGEISVSVGDLVRVSTPRKPLTGQSIDLHFAIEFPPEAWRKVAEAPPGVEGPIGRDYFLEAIAPGEGKITLRLVRGEETVEEASYAFEIRE